MPRISGVPFGIDITKTAGKIVSDWADWFLALLARVNANTEILKSVEVPAVNTTLNAAIGTTTIPTGLLGAGYYRMTYYLRKTTPDGAGSSLTVTLGWTDGGVSCTFPFSALTTDTTAAVQSETKTVRSDSAFGLTYAVAYASTTPGAMKYRFTVFVEALPTT